MAGSAASNYFAPYRKWPAIERTAMRYVRGRVLDVGCGAGRHCIYLQERGHQVVGIDVSKLAVEVCRRLGVQDVHQVPLGRLTPAYGEFDSVLMMGHNFGLLRDTENARRQAAKRK